jgi:hypothetical protein
MKKLHSVEKQLKLRDGSTTAQVFEMLKTGRPVKKNELRKAAAKKGVNVVSRASRLGTYGRKHKLFRIIIQGGKNGTVQLQPFKKAA